MLIMIFFLGIVHFMFRHLIMNNHNLNYSGCQST